MPTRHMQVWLGRRVTPEHHSADWQAMVDSPRPWAPKAADTHIPLHAHCKLVAARQRVTVASIMDCTAMPLIERLADRGHGAGSTFHNREAIAEELCNRFCLYWRHEDLHDAGVCSGFLSDKLRCYQEILCKASMASHMAEVAMCTVQPFQSRLEPCPSRERCLLRAWTLRPRPSFVPLP